MHTIAVLRFTDLSALADQEHLCIGIADEINGDLSRLDGMRVASRAAAFALADRGLEAVELGRELGADSVLTGSILKSDDDLQISARLVDVAAGGCLWSGDVDGTTADIFASREEISQGVAAALHLRLSDAQLRAIGKAGTRSVEAYELYLRGRQFFFRSNRKGVDSAVEMFNRAILADPSYALAYAGLADCHAYLFMYFNPDTANLKIARNASKHALSLDHDLAEAHAARGLAVSLSERYEEAEAEFEEAIRLDPQRFEAYYFYARTCFTQGKYELACRLYETASEVKPDDSQALTLLGFTYRTMGDQERAAEASERALERLERHLAHNPDDPRAIYLSADALAGMGEDEEALRRAERAASLDPDDPYTVYGLACVYSQLGETDKALTALEAAIEHGFGHKAWVVNDSDFNALHEDSRFQALLERMSPPAEGST